MPDPAHSYLGIFGPGRGIAINRVTDDIYVGSYAGVIVFSAEPPTKVPTVTTGDATPSLKGAQLRGTVEPDEVPTTACYFEWGTSAEKYGNVAPCAQGDVLNGSGEVEVTAGIGGLEPGATYHFRLAAENANEILEFGKDSKFVAQGEPKVTDEYATISVPTGP